MEFACNYSALIQLAVTFSFVFVVLREESVNLASDVISSIFKNMRESLIKECGRNMEYIPVRSFDVCPVERREILKKEFNKVEAYFSIFIKLIEWKPVYMAPWCLLCGLYSMVLLFLYAELNGNQSYLTFFRVFVELCTLLHLYYLILEMKRFFLNNGTEISHKSYTKPLFAFVGILALSAFCLFGEFSLGSPIVSIEFLFYWSLFLAFIPLITVGILSMLFLLLGYIYENLLYQNIDILNIDYNSAIREMRSNDSLSFGKRINEEKLDFKKIN